MPGPSKLSANHCNLDLMCPHMSKHDECIDKNKDKIVSYDIDINTINNDIDLIINILIYRTIESFLAQPNIDLILLEKKYSKACIGSIGQSDKAVKAITSGWVKFIGIQERLIELINESEFMTPRIVVTNNLGSPPNRYTMVIDLLLVDDKGYRMVKIGPSNGLSGSRSILSNVDIMSCLSMLDEADMMPYQLIHIGYRRDSVTHGFNEKTYSLRGYDVGRLERQLREYASQELVSPYKCYSCSMNMICDKGIKT